MLTIHPSSPETSRRMAKIRQKGTDAELALRRELYRKGLRYRVSYEVLKKPRRVADVAFPGLKIAVFVDGCFWHGCPLHASWPKVNAEFWRAKIETNRARDADTDRRLHEFGWEVVRIWAHESPIDAARHVSSIVENRKHKKQTATTIVHRNFHQPPRRPSQTSQ